MQNLKTNKKFELFDRLMETNKSKALGYLKYDPSLFAYFFFKNSMHERFKVLPFQDMILNDESTRILLCCARQIGKTTTVAIKALHYAYFNSPKNIIIVSATKNQSKEVIYRMRQLLRTARFTTWTELSPTARDSKSELVIRSKDKKSQSRIISLPATDAGRGYTADIAIVDEAAFIENGDYIFNQVVEPMTSRTKGSIMLLSTPNGKRGFFWNCYHSDYYSVYHFDWQVNPETKEEEMKEKRTRMTTREFQAEYEARFVASKSAYFTHEEIKKAISDEADRGVITINPIAVGVDFGKINDKSIIMIGTIENPEAPQHEQTIKVLKRIVKPLGTNYADIIGELKAINQMYHPSIFVLDATGVGEGPSDLLIKEGIPVEPIRFSWQKKANIFSNLKIFFEQKRIKIPNELELIDQLEMFEYEYTESGVIKLHHPLGGHDDECDSLALMTWGLSSAMTPPVSMSFIPTKNILTPKRNLFI